MTQKYFAQATPEPSGLKQEIKGLEALEYQMSFEFEAMRDRADNAKFSRTWKGRLFNCSGRLFAVYCILRIISVRVLVSTLRIGSEKFICCVPVNPESTYTEAVKQFHDDVSRHPHPPPRVSHLAVSFY